MFPTLSYVSIISYKVGKTQQYVASILMILFLSGICFLFSSYIGPQVVAFILLLALSLIAMFFDIIPVLMGAVLSSLIWDYFFLLPRYNLRVGNTEDKILLSMYFVIALLNAVLTFKIRQVEKIVRIKEEKAKTLKLYNTLLNSLSHELRTPIATIIGATDNLLAVPSRLGSGDSRKLLSAIATASLRLNRQVENLLNMSRLESGFIRPKKDWCDIQELVNGILRQLEEQSSSHIVITVIGEGIPLIKLDYGWMEQILSNLIINACLYTPEGSLIRIEAACSGEMLEIIVEDDGKGIAEDEIGKVFDKFYRPADSPAGGSGLGLSIVKGFVEAHDGTVDLRNVPSGGARFIIRLPAEKLSIKQTGKWVLEKY
jgi:two-component system, OmpR family, sensor histidine kinase KdpD